MKKCIYKITNLINGKIYIGQTNNYNRRHREHKNKMYGNCEKVLYNAINAYGFENFEMEQIEDYIENYNEREQYWIEYYDCKVPKGYNVDPVLNHSDTNIYIDENTIQLIYQDLKDLTLSFDEIAEKYDLKSAQSIRNINKGITHRIEGNQYPIRKTRNDLAQERALLVIQDLKNTDLKFSELAKKYNCSSTAISNINTGERCRQKNEVYPIRENTRKSQVFTQETIDEIYNDLINTQIKYSDLAKKYNCGTKVFQHINQGTLHQKEGYTYPLRKESYKKGMEKVPQIIHLLKTTSMTYAAIGKEVGVDPSTVSNINRGKSHKQENIEYPIRK
jgi:group I intron endonuclease